MAVMERRAGSLVITYIFLVVESRLLLAMSSPVPVLTHCTTGFPGLKTLNVTAWGEARSAEPQVGTVKQSHRPVRAGPVTRGIPGGEECRPFRPPETIWHAYPGPPLATLAPAQAVTGRAFSPLISNLFHDQTCFSIQKKMWVMTRP